MQQKLTPQIIEAAIKGYEAQKAEIDSQIAELRSLLHGVGHSEPAASNAIGRPRKKFSDATRRTMTWPLKFHTRYKPHAVSLLSGHAPNSRCSVALGTNMAPTECLPESARR